MRIDRVTMTGADDSIKPEDLMKLSVKYPFVEWGILFSEKHQGYARFPSSSWLGKLRSEWRDGVKLSAHICGKYTRDLIDGSQGGDLFKHEMYAQIHLFLYQRMQWNFHAERFKSVNFVQVRDHLDNYSLQEHIFQADGVNDDLIGILRKLGVKISPLYDTSGGAGIVPEEWPAPMPDVYCGYAGGLGPDTMKAELRRLEPIVGDRTIWIDMERRVRSEDDAVFDLAKVETCLKLAQEWL